MSFGFDSVAHEIASGLNAVHKALQYVEKKVIPGIQSTEKSVEAITALIPKVGTKAVAIERAGYSALGYIGAVIEDLDSVDQAVAAAANKKLADLGLDKTAIESFKQLFIDLKDDLAKIGTTLTLKSA